MKETWAEHEYKNQHAGTLGEDGSGAMRLSTHQMIMWLEHPTHGTIHRRDTELQTAPEAQRPCEWLNVMPYVKV